MSSPKPLPDTFRHLRTRLRVLQRPAVWGSLGILLLAIVVLAEYWNPQQSRTQSNARYTLPQRPSPIDPYSTDGNDDANGLPTVPDTLSSLKSGTPSTSATPSPQPTGTAQRQSIDAINGNRVNTSLPGLIGSPDATTASPNGTMLADPVPSLDTLGSSVPGTTSSAGQTAGQSGTSAASPLQSALDRHAASASPSATPTTPTPNSLGYSSGTYSPGAYSQGAYSSGAYSSGAYGQLNPLTGQPTYVPQTSPPPGTTGYTLPPAFQTAPTTQTGLNNGYSRYGGAVPQPVPGQYASPNAGQVSPSQLGGYGSFQAPQPQGYTRPAGFGSSAASQTVPFSVPRSAPGQYSGGGQINTFSNP